MTNDLKKKKGGAPPGNQNARKHGFYSKVLAPAEKRILDDASGVDGLERFSARRRPGGHDHRFRIGIVLIQSLDGRPQHVTNRVRFIEEGNPHNDIRCAYVLRLTERALYRLPKTVPQLVAARDSI